MTETTKKRDLDSRIARLDEERAALLAKRAERDLRTGNENYRRMNQALNACGWLLSNSVLDTQETTIAEKFGAMLTAKMESMADREASPRHVQH